MKAEKRYNTLMKRLIKYFLIIILSMALLNAYSSFRFKSFNMNIYGMLTRLVDIYSISVKVGILYKDIENYAHSGSAEYVESYNKEFFSLVKMVDNLKKSSSGDEYYLFGDINNMIASFDEQSKYVIKSYESRVQPILLYESIAELAKLRGYIEEEVKNILIGQLGAIMTYYNKFLEDVRRQENVVYFLTALITALCILIAVRFSREISKPIHMLVQKLMKVAKGDFEVDNIGIKASGEINILVDSFNFMTVKIKELIGEIKAKADIEKELTEQRIENLEMSNLLKQAELEFLQSQINPHFLYNTLNSISALSMIEGADQTTKMITSLSEILKYSLKKINKNVTLMEEFKIIECYLFIQKARFADRIEYELDFDEAVMDYFVPSMILQPFVENAIIHGLEPKEEKGHLCVKIEDKTSDILIRIKDDGMGMNEETLQRFFNADDAEDGKQTRGIGVKNVVRRLELKYGRNIIDIKSKKGHGTEVSILLPKAV